MWVLLAPLLLSVAQALLNKVAPKLGELVIAAVDAWIRNLEASGIPPDEVQDVLWPTSLFIANGVFTGHPEWSVMECATWAKDAINHMLLSHGRSAADPAVSWIVDSAVNVAAAARAPDASTRTVATVAAARAAQM